MNLLKGRSGKKNHPKNQTVWYGLGLNAEGFQIYRILGKILSLKFVLQIL